ncbi:MAG: DUF350 domain-containing protein [Fluviicola sp.]|nr:DUF350 domain-containing protein [Fluviicola sp.]
MNEKIALLGFVEIISSLSCGIVILFLTYKILKIYGHKRLGIDHNNLAYNILIAGVLLSVGYTVSGVIHPILDSYRIISSSDVSKTALVLSFLAYGGLYILIAYISAMIVVFLGLFIYSTMTSVSELQELKNNNVGVAIVLVAIIFTLSLITSNGIVLLIESFIPYPDLPVRIG